MEDWATYSDLHPGASGGIGDPDAVPQAFTGSTGHSWRQLWKPHEVDGAQISRVRGGSRTLNPWFGFRGRHHHNFTKPIHFGATYNDSPHIPALDGWRGTEVAMHNNAYFGNHYAIDHEAGAVANFRHMYMNDPDVLAKRSIQFGVTQGDTRAQSGLGMGGSAVQGRVHVSRLLRDRADMVAGHTATTPDIRKQRLAEMRWF